MKPETPTTSGETTQDDIDNYIVQFETELAEDLGKLALKRFAKKFGRDVARGKAPGALAAFDARSMIANAFERAATVET